MLREISTTPCSSLSSDGIRRFGSLWTHTHTLFIINGELGCIHRSEEGLGMRGGLGFPPCRKVEVVSDDDNGGIVVFF